MLPLSAGWISSSLEVSRRKSRFNWGESHRKTSANQCGHGGGVQNGVRICTTSNCETTQPRILFNSLISSPSFSSIIQCSCGLYVPVYLSYLTLQTPTLIYVTNGLEVNDGLILDQVRRKRTKIHCKQAREGDFVEGWRWELRGWFLWIRTLKGEWMIWLFLIEITSMKTIERRKRWRKQRKKMNTEKNDIKTTSAISITLQDAHNISYSTNPPSWNPTPPIRLPQPPLPQPLRTPSPPPPPHYLPLHTLPCPQPPGHAPTANLPAYSPSGSSTTYLRSCSPTYQPHKHLSFQSQKIANTRRAFRRRCWRRWRCRRGFLFPSWGISYGWREFVFGI